MDASGAAATRELISREAATLRVLLIDDDADEVSRCRAAISSLPDLCCQVTSVDSLREAMACLSDDDADLALVDLTLPDASGLEVVTVLARRFRQLPIVVLTDLRDEHTAIQALHAGAQDYLVKGSSDAETIGRAIRYAVERKQAEQMRRDRDAADSTNRAKSAFLSQMSHELRTPLTAILGFAQLLEMQVSDQDQELVKPILRAGRHLQRLIEEILDIARIDAGELSLSLEPVHISEVLDESVALIHPLATSRGINIDLDLAGVENLYILADRQRVSQVFLNLLSNAVKYDHDGGQTTVRCRHSAGRLRVEVCDTGDGLTPEQIAGLFTPFNRLGTEGAGVAGTGLGLVITKRLVEAMGGVIGLDSTKLAGTTAWTEWTVVPDPTLAPAPAVAPDSVALEGVVLYIEDNLVNVSLVETLLARHPAVRLMSVMKAHLGLELAEQHHPDLVLLDSNLPDMSGEEALAQLRAQPSTRDIPVVVISADVDPANADRLLARGAHAYLTKPFNVDELVSTIAAAIRPAG